MRLPKALTLTFLTLILSLLTISSASAFERQFGLDGRSGAHGMNGWTPSTPADRTIFAGPTFVNLNLSGQDGEDGTDGKNGEDAAYCHQPYRPENDLRGARGGYGGNAGNGGNGGSSASLIVYFQNIEDIKNIFVNAAPGKGGQAGTYGRGGRGCRCYDHFWTVEHCTTTVDGNGNTHQTCYSDHYRCRDGRDGKRGSSGTNGFDGGMGDIYLIESPALLEATLPAANVPMVSMTNGPFTLSNLQWSVQPGATGLFAPGSYIKNSFYLYEGRIEKELQFIWNADRPLADFAGLNVYVTLDQSGALTVRFPSDLWLDYEVMENAGTTEIIVNNAFKSLEVKNLELTSISGVGTDLIAVVTDHSAISHLINTSFDIKYFVKGYIYYNSKFIGPVTPELIDVTAEALTIRVGQLPIKAKYLKKGKKIRIRLITKRRFNGYETELEVVKNHTIK